MRRAILKFGPRGNNVNPASSNVYVHRWSNDTWTEADYPVGNRDKKLPNGESSITKGTSGAIKFAGTWQYDFVKEGDITAFVRAAREEGRDKLTLSLTVTDNYAIGASHHHDVIAPPQIWVDMAESDDAPPATPAWAYYPQESRTTLCYARVNNFSNKDSGSNSQNETGDTSQTGSSDSGTTKRVLYTFFQFDPKGLENTPYVRLRLRVQSTGYWNGVRRLFGRETPPWDCSKVTWNNMMNEFDDSRVETIPSGELPNQMYAIGYNFGAADHTSFIEADVTELVHRAARAGKYATFMVGANDNAGWTWYYTEKTSNAALRPQLVYPAIRGFAQQLSATTGTDARDGHKTAEISWTPSTVEGTTYAVSRCTLGEDDTKELASGLVTAAFVDRKARSDRDYVYTVTATEPGSAAAKTAVFTNRIDCTVTIANTLDGYVRNGNSKSNSSNWTARSIVMKDGSGADDGATREGFVRFPLDEVPADAMRILLKLRHGSLGVYNYDEKLCFRVATDIDRTDANPPTWTDLLGSQAGASAVNKSGTFYVRDLNTNRLTDFGEVEVEVTEQVLAAKRNNETHILFHTFLDDPGCGMNFGFVTKESPYVTSAARLVCERKNAYSEGMAIFVR